VSDREKNHAPVGRPASGEPSWISRFSAEVFGTFALTLAGCGIEAAASLHPEISHAERAVAPALMVLALIYAISDISGAHINPAVTLSFAVRGVFAWRWVPVYWGAQVGGALMAAAVVKAVFGRAVERGATSPALSPLGAVAVEALLTLLLVSVILQTSKRKPAVGATAAVAVGAIIAVADFWAGPVTGASMNPARSLGPALFGPQPGICWIYVVGPFVGALLAVPLTHLIHGPASLAEEEAARGGGDSDDGHEGPSSGGGKPTCAQDST
jgi:MIP family channel proteins